MSNDREAFEAWKAWYSEAYTSFIPMHNGELANLDQALSFHTWRVASQAKRTAELEAPSNPYDRVDIQGKLYITGLHNQIESLRKQSEEMLTAMRRSVLALAFAAESSKAMQDDYQALSNAIAKAVASKNGD